MLAGNAGAGRAGEGGQKARGRQDERSRRRGCRGRLRANREGEPVNQVLIFRRISPHPYHGSQVMAYPFEALKSLTPEPPGFRAGASLWKTRPSWFGILLWAENTKLLVPIQGVHRYWCRQGNAPGAARLHRLPFSTTPPRRSAACESKRTPPRRGSTPPPASRRGRR